MTVYSKIAKIRVPDVKNPTREIDLFLKKNPGIDYITLQFTPALNQATYQFVCSDNNPFQSRTMEDIDRLLTHLNIIKEMPEHANQPLKNAKHLLQIDANLDDPNIDQTKAKDIHDETISREQIQTINEEYQRHNKALSDTSKANSDKRKLLDRNKTNIKVGTIERA
jgi:organic radical activating enzyme